jgi:hypothetical protein
LGEKLDRLVELARTTQVETHLRKTGKGIVRVKSYTRFLGHDASGNEITVGSPVKIIAGPDKGSTAEVTGQTQGGGISVRIGFGLQKRQAVVDPDELRVMVRSFQPKR